MLGKQNRYRNTNKQVRRQTTCKQRETSKQTNKQTYKQKTREAVINTYKDWYNDRNITDKMYIDK